MQRLIVLGVLAGFVLARPVRAQEFYPRDTETYMINYQAFAKSPATAYLLSAAPGFGLGHFYADHATRGVIFLVGEVVGIGLLLLPNVGDMGATAQDLLFYSGLAIFSGFKIADMYLAPDSVEIYNRKVAKRLKIKALTLRHERPGGETALAYGLTLETPL